MNCPTCNVTLLLTEMQGVSIDYCPQCRGLWLEKGKLEKIIEKNVNNGFSNSRNYISDDHHKGHDDHYYQGGHRKKKGLFDFFD